jgi:hypothetical protein
MASTLAIEIDFAIYRPVSRHRDNQHTSRPKGNDRGLLSVVAVLILTRCAV